jgi:hypothetical protein
MFNLLVDFIDASMLRQSVSKLINCIHLSFASIPLQTCEGVSRMIQTPSISLEAG